jgi:REP element-mobilizing transposase RayT
MTQARENQISLDDTSFYHCYVRCVRRAFLCGSDKATGNNYDHRKQWLVSRIRFLSYIYAIDICAYAVMSNHYHVVLHVDQPRAKNWTDEEVVERWLQLYKGNFLIQRWQNNKTAMTKAELLVIADIIEDWRERLCSISWFMRGINETIARMANEEENTKGRFWEGRFKSQALLDEGALLTCMAYVDLNPVRANVVDDLINSDFTSIQQRLFSYVKSKTKNSATEKKLNARVNYQNQLKTDLNLDELPEADLMPFDGSAHTDVHQALPFTEADYMELVDDTGRVLRSDKRGAINSKLLPLLARLGIRSDQWVEHVKSFQKRYASCAGSPVAMRLFSDNKLKPWCKGVGISGRVYRKVV